MLAGDFSTHRTDAMASTWNPGNEGMTPNTTFASPIDNPDILNDGAPWTSIYATRFWEIGAGVLFNIDLFQRTNLTLGGRFDGSRARNDGFPGAQREHRHLGEPRTVHGRDHDARLGSGILVERERHAGDRARHQGLR